MSEDSTKNKNIKMVVKVMNIMTSFVLIGFGIAGCLYLISNSITSGKFFLIFSPIFMILFGLMLLAAEFKVKFLMKHFGFLNSFLGRGVFNFYLASSVFFYFSCGSNNDILGWISAITIFVLGIIYCVMHCFCRDASKEEEPSGGSTAKQQMM